MDKVLLSQDDVGRLFAWKDQHLEEVCSMPVPVKSIEIVLTGLEMKLKCIRDKSKLTIHIYSEKMKHGKLEFLVAAGLCLCRKNTVDIKTMTNEHINSILTCYGALMAFMVYERPVMERAEPQTTAQKPHRPRQGPRKAKGNTYIVHWSRSTSQTKSGGHHASPVGIFSVRGHYRHYKSGKVVWINEFKKGEGKKKCKIYKIGGAGRDISGNVEETPR